MKCSRSTPIFSRTVLPHHFTRPFTKIHKPLFEMLDDEECRAAAFACPRGFGKTTITSGSHALKKALFLQARYILLISSTFKKAIKDLNTIAMEIKTNEFIREVWGDLVGDKWAEGTGSIELSHGVMIECLGAGQQVRGLKYRQYRPDLIICDDIEDAEGVRNPESRKKLKEWFFADMLNSVSRKTTKVVLVGTVLHEDALLSNLLEESSWSFEEGEDSDFIPEEIKILEQEKFKTLRLEVCGDDFESLWPEFMTTEQIKAKVAAYRRRGLLDVFFREYRNIPVSSEEAPFPREFQYYKPEDIGGSAENVVIIDPAKTANIKSDYSAVVGVGFDSTKGQLLFADRFNGKVHPEEIYEEAWRMACRLKTYSIGVEVTSLNEFITYPLNNFLASKGFPPVVELKARGRNKEERIKALIPFYRMGKVYHNKAVSKELEAQMFSFPRSKNDDLLDAFAYSLEMFAIGDRFFQMGDGDYEPAFEDEKIYTKPLTNWRIA